MTKTEAMRLRAGDQVVFPGYSQPLVVVEVEAHGRSARIFCGGRADPYRSQDVYAVTDADRADFAKAAETAKQIAWASQVLDFPVGNPGVSVVPQDKILAWAGEVEALRKLAESKSHHTTSIWDPPH